MNNDPYVKWTAILIISVFVCIGSFKAFKAYLVAQVQIAQMKCDN